LTNGKGDAYDGVADPRSAIALTILFYFAAVLLPTRDAPYLTYTYRALSPACCALSTESCRKYVFERKSCRSRREFSL